ncbi:hypothetical protein JX265_010526 [Neoarthrinium moseri]|uniref:Uncharacterized protein n=1 Tax=Neoarthrinium moseri TaxID=1658444 RepID=A0A9Q0AK80_9PEZI|nr:hypothetical protein JX265_010526 [Neoarthrinium moseri]
MFRAILTVVGIVMSQVELAQAIPNVTVTPLPPTCASYPAYDNSTGQAGPWYLVADATGSSIDGFAATATYYTNPDFHRWGFITIPSVKATKNPAMRCANGTLQVQLSTGNNNTAWQDIVVAGDNNWQAGIGFAFPGDQSKDIPVQPYAHFINGTRQPGVFLGAKNVTTWYFKDNWAGNAGEYYLLRLWASGTELEEKDHAGFLKLVV